MLDEHQEEPEDGSTGVSGSKPEGERLAGTARRVHPERELADPVKELSPNHVIGEPLAGAQTRHEIIGQGGLPGQLTKRMVEHAMEVELTNHSVMNRTPSRPAGLTTPATGSPPSSCWLESGEVQINTRCDRDGSFESRLVKKPSAPFHGFRDKILALPRA